MSYSGLAKELFDMTEKKSEFNSLQEIVRGIKRGQLDYPEPIKILLIQLSRAFIFMRMSVVWIFIGVIFSVYSWSGLREGILLASIFVIVMTLNLIYHPSLKLKLDLLKDAFKILNLTLEKFGQLSSANQVGAPIQHLENLADKMNGAKDEYSKKRHRVKFIQDYQLLLKTNLISDKLNIGFLIH